MGRGWGVRWDPKVLRVLGFVMVESEHSAAHDLNAAHEAVRRGVAVCWSRLEAREARIQDFKERHAEAIRQTRERGERAKHELDLLGFSAAEASASTNLERARLGAHQARRDAAIQEIREQDASTAVVLSKEPAEEATPTDMAVWFYAPAHRASLSYS